MRKLIRHNQVKKAEAVFNNASNIKSYTLDNCFRGEPCNRLDYEGNNWLQKDWKTFDFARLTQEENGEYCLHIHSNCWYEFTN